MKLGLSDLRVAVTIAALGLTLVVLSQSATTISFPQDKGQDRVDVSSYPKEIQDGYKVFSDKCSRCHTLARPINTSMDNQWWAHYVGDMARRPRYGMSTKDATAIAGFLIFDQENRKAKHPEGLSRALTEDEILELRLKEARQ